MTNSLKSQSNNELLKLFNQTDTALQCQFIDYAISCFSIKSVDLQTLSNLLPTQGYKITSNWARNWNKSKFLEHKEAFLDICFPKHHLISLLSHVDALINNTFRLILKEKAATQQLQQSFLQIKDGEAFNKIQKGDSLEFGRSLAWAFPHILVSKHPSQDLQSRKEMVCSKLDGARRARNCIVHNNGFFNTKYEGKPKEIQYFQQKNILREELDGFSKYKQKNSLSIPVIVNREIFKEYYLSAVEFVHLLYFAIGEIYFQQNHSLNYEEEYSFDPFAYLFGTDDAKSISQLIQENTWPFLEETNKIPKINIPDFKML